jgi:hypothetical protein
LYISILSILSTSLVAMRASSNTGFAAPPADETDTEEDDDEAAAATMKQRPQLTEREVRDAAVHDSADGEPVVLASRITRTCAQLPHVPT